MVALNRHLRYIFDYALSGVEPVFPVSCVVADFNKVAARVPHIGDTKPHGKYHMADIDRIGGVPVVLRLVTRLSHSRTSVEVGDKGITIGKFELIRMIGHGAMGEVYLAKDPILDRPVAIKTIRLNASFEADAQSRFEREARMLVQVNHPGVVTVHDSGEVGDGSMYLIMERLFGMDLANALHRFGPGSPRQVASLIRQGADALDAAHRCHIVHRDIKPQNLFLVPVPGGFQVKILDFGLAKSLGGDAKLTQSGFLLGTPAYLAPEQILGRDSDVRSDLYSFAALSLPASVEAVLNALSPCFGAIFAAIWLGEPLSGRKVLGLGLGLAGVGIVSGIGRGSGGNATLVAALACVAATACYGLAGVFIKKKAKYIESRSMAAGSQLLGGLFLLPSLAFFPPSGILQPKVALITLLFALLCSAIAYLIYYRLIADVGPTKALTVTFLIPVFGFLWGGLFFGEAIDPPMLGGSVLILCGTYLVAANAKKSRLFPANPH